MKVLILCGGMGTRLREYTELRPKPMVEIGGRPILWHLMKLYAHYGMDDFILCLGYKGHVIKEYFLNYEAMNSDFTVALSASRSVTYHAKAHGESSWKVTLADTGEKTMTGARVRRGARYLGDSQETFCVTYGDGVADVDLKAAYAFHRAHGKLATVTGVRPPSRFGELTLDGGRVACFSEKPQLGNGLINGGFFFFEPAFIEKYLSGEASCVLEHEPLQRLARDGELFVYKHAGCWQCMDTYRDWEHLEKLWQEGAAPWKVWP